MSSPQVAGDDVSAMVTGVLAGTFTVTVTEHPAPSVTVKVCIPGGTFEMVNGSFCEVPLVPFGPVQLYGAVPPVTSMVTVPFDSPQVVGVAVAVAVMALEAVTVAQVVLEQPVSSVTVTQ